MDIAPAKSSPWVSGNTDLWLSLLIGLLAAISTSNLLIGAATSILVLSVFKYVESRAEENDSRSRELLTRLPVQAL